MTGFRMIRSVSRGLHALHPAPRAIIGFVLLLFAWPWFERASHAMDPLGQEADHLIGWFCVVTGAWLFIPGLWFGGRLAFGRWGGAPVRVRRSRPFGDAGTASERATRRGLGEKTERGPPIEFPD